tara:strand:- start:5834 stop:6262 length:429 start_codon:yes stop_codon:yes gene_type:complete
MKGIVSIFSGACLLAIIFILQPKELPADNHNEEEIDGVEIGYPPPTPELHIIRFGKEIIIEFLSDSNNPNDMMHPDPEQRELRPVWYIFEVLDPNKYGPGSQGWVRPFFPLMGSQYNELITVQTNTDFAPTGIIRIIAMWGA